MRSREAWVAAVTTVVSCDYDLEKIFQDLKEQERQSGRKVVTLPPKRPLAIDSAR